MVFSKYPGGAELRRGLLATKDIKKGQMIFCETYMTFELAEDMKDALEQYKSFYDMDDKKQLEMIKRPYSRHVYDNLLPHVVKRSSEIEKLGTTKGFKKIDHIVEAGKVMAIFATNCIASPKHDFYILGHNTSLIEHSCTPNALASMRTKSYEINVFALEDIKRGEEIFISRVDQMGLFEERKKQLKYYDLRCGCFECQFKSPYTPDEEVRSRFKKPQQNVKKDTSTKDKAAIWEAMLGILDGEGDVLMPYKAKL